MERATVAICRETWGKTSQRYQHKTAFYGVTFVIYDIPNLRFQAVRTKEIRIQWAKST